VNENDFITVLEWRGARANSWLIPLTGASAHSYNSGREALRRSRTCDTGVSLGNSNFSSDKPYAS